MSVDQTTGEIQTVPLADAQLASPAQTAARLREAADAFRELTAGLDLFTEVRKGGSLHLSVDGYQLAALLVGITAVVTGTEQIEKGWSATAEARRLSDGQVVGAASALCTRDESRWSRADEYALCSMASTRAQSRALRAVVAPIVKLADPSISTTAAEEMPAQAARPSVPTISYQEISALKARAKAAQVDDAGLLQAVWAIAAPDQPLPAGSPGAILDKALPRVKRDQLDEILERIGGDQ
jgi:hypothetical protein